MNLYVSSQYKNILLEKLKENQIIDEYILDRERLGKTKISLKTKENVFAIIENLYTILPVDSMIVDQIEYPGKEYILCIGEIEFEDFSYLKENNFNISIITKKEKNIRFNAWIKFDQLHEIYKENIIKNFSSINGKIEEKTFFIIETHDDKIDILNSIFSYYSNEFIIKERKIYVKLLLQNFCKIYEEIKNIIEKIEIIDEDIF